MVRGYDPISSDLTTLVWNHLFSLTNNAPVLSLQDAHKYIAHWLTHSLPTATLYRSFAASAIKPSIRLKKHCNWGSLQGEG
jgi:hypothetical protein